MNVNSLKEKENAGKSIFVTGAPFSGKTFLISSLLYTVPWLKVVNYELYFAKGKGYYNFYKHIKDLVDSGDVVIGESVNNYLGRKHEWCPFEFKDSLNIVVKIDYNKYLKNYLDFQRNFGKEALRLRTGGVSVDDLRANFKVPHDKFVIYNGDNLEEIIETVKRYVLGS